MEGIISGSIAVIIGILFIIYGIYCKFIRRLYPDPKKWVKVKAKIVGNHFYESKELSPPGNPSFFKMQPQRKNESVIEYKVEGKIYRKTIKDAEKGSICIYCKKKNPGYFKTMSEIKSNHYMNKHKASFFASLITGIIIIIIGTVFIRLGCGDLSQKDLMISVYPPQ